MILKGTGIIIILFSCTAIGMYKSYLYVDRLNYLHEVKKAFLYIQGEMRYMNTPMPELLERTSVYLKQPFGCFFKKMSEKLEANYGGDFQKIWECCVAEEIPDDVLQTEARREFIEIGSHLGCLDQKAQEQSICYFLEKWNWLIEKRQKEKSNYLRLYSVCGIMGGLLLVMILI